MLLDDCMTGATGGRSVQQSSSSDSDQLPTGYLPAFVFDFG